MTGADIEESDLKATLKDLSAPEAMRAGNPLLTRQFVIPFDKIETHHMEPAMEALIAEADARLRAVEELKGERTFENTMLSYERATEGLDYGYRVIEHLESVATSEEFRAAYNTVEDRVMAFFTSVPLREGLWRAIKEYAATDEAKSLTGDRQRFLEKTVREFKRKGADLNPEEKARLESLDAELTRLTTKFSQNLKDATNAFEVVTTDSAKVAGLPESALKAALASAQKKGLEGWRFTLDAPSYSAVIQYADDAELRRTMYEAYNSRASEGEKDNTKLIPEILRLRKEKAQLLGFQDFADYILADRMAKEGKSAMAFEEDIRAKVTPFAKAEREDLMTFRRELEGPDAPPIEPWDVSYYAEKLRQARYDFDSEILRPYFSAERVLQGAFNVAERLYGVKITRTSDVPVWHPDVRTYAMHDTDGTLLGAFYVDLFPREAKRTGAWMNDLMTGGVVPDGFEPHLGLFCANFTEPVDGRPALLRHSEVETLFHEWGHLLHQLLGRPEIKSLSGMRVPWDFIEFPSQIMENWCWEREVLDLFAEHYETDEKIPEELFDKLRAARNFQAASFYMRQLSLGTVDLKLHREYSIETDGDVTTYSNGLFEEFSGLRYPPSYAFIAGFAHLFSDPTGYASGYYSYLWAEAHEADAFSRFKEEGVLSRDTGMRFRRTVLEKGDGEDPDLLFWNFMERAPNGNALLKRSGLTGA